MSALVKSGDRIFTKMEMNNPGGSHKFRAADFIIQTALRRGEILPGVTTVIEKTGGNFGFGLIAACNKHGIPIELAVGLSFSETKRNLLECFGAKLIGKSMMAAGSSPKEVVSFHLQHQAALGKSYFYTDQFENHAGVDAHRYQTAPELAHQLREKRASKKLLFIGCAGTGASFTGITLGLMDQGFDVSTIMVEPSGCDSRKGVFLEHRFEGMAVGVPPPFIDWSLVNHLSHVKLTEMLDAQRWFYLQNGNFVGNTAAACLAVAKRFAHDAEYANSSMVTIAYDTGLWYQDLQNSLKS